MTKEAVSLRAEGAAISVGYGFAELVPSETRNLASPPDFVVA